MRLAALFLLPLSLAGSGPTGETHSLTLQERIAAQTAIERVYYNHRIWPKQNPGNKPPFEMMVPNMAITRRPRASAHECCDGLTCN